MKSKLSKSRHYKLMMSHVPKPTPKKVKKVRVKKVTEPLIPDFLKVLDSGMGKI